MDVGREAERAFLEAKDTVGLPSRCTGGRQPEPQTRGEDVALWLVSRDVGLYVASSSRYFLSLKKRFSV